jgi:cytochrome c553
MKGRTRVGIALLTSVVVGVSGLAGLAFEIPERHMHADWSSIPGRALTVPTDADSLARGEHVATALGGCDKCHGGDFGGKVVIPQGVMGLFAAPNLTPGPGGVLAGYDIQEFERLLHDGVRADGTSVRFMPTTTFHHLADTDVADLYAYLKSLPPIDRTEPPVEVGPLTRVLYLFGKFPLVQAELIDHAEQAPPAPPPIGPTAAYGAYLGTHCQGCHGDDLVGGPVPGGPPDWPPAANLTRNEEVGLGKWSGADFARALRQGTKPDGTALRLPMAGAFAMLSDDEVAALWAWLETVPARP